MVSLKPHSVEETLENFSRSGGVPFCKGTLAGPPVPRAEFWSLHMKTELVLLSDLELSEGSGCPVLGLEGRWE